ncbi:hypothetical protein MsAg5_15610 [Methanosarcinaceae archaeon Ag5]|uniref:Uncharacterized protein n=1 Tax=Methanolapillus africanus TaxID=3028297 RepID=A0AAE4MKQ6_9EURY|nr:hypothetical protein [Methanosarcinaceae archaeon Ag5]
MDLHFSTFNQKADEYAANHPKRLWAFLGVLILAAGCVFSLEYGSISYAVLGAFWAVIWCVVFVAVGPALMTFVNKAKTEN